MSKKIIKAMASLFVVLTIVASSFNVTGNAMARADDLVTNNVGLAGGLVEATSSIDVSFIRTSFILLEHQTYSVLNRPVPVGLSATFTSSNPDVVQVNAEGDVKAMRSGTANITVVVSNAFGETATMRCVIAVYMASGLFYIKNKNSGQYLTVSNGIDADGQNVIQTKMDANNTSNNSSRLWRLTHVGVDRFRIVSQVGSKTRVLTLDLGTGGANGNATNLVIDTYSSSTSDQHTFAIRLNSDLYSYRIASKSSNYNKVATVASASCDVNSNVFQYDYNGNMNDEWIFEPYEYIPDRAVNYARVNYNSHVYTYPLFEGDCTNFVSQCMLAGGRHFKNEWYIYKRSNSSDLTPEDSLIDENWDIGTFSNDVSPWISVKGFYDFWTEEAVYYDKFTKQQYENNPGTIYNMNYDVGDVVQVIQSGFLGSVYKHTMVITKKENGDYYFTYHSNNRLDYNWDTAIPAFTNVEYIVFYKMD